jgi:RNA polymerase sigma-70 factor, ECF subfamily
MARLDAETEELLRLVGRGDDVALHRLLGRHSDRLRRTVAVHMDRRLAKRLDPSDIVQEALTDASRKLSGYLRDQPLPFYPWLRRLALERLRQAYRRHLWSTARAVSREEPEGLPLPGESAIMLVDRLAASGTSPSQAMMQDERREQLLAALGQLTPSDRQVLVMRYLEELSFGEIAAALGVGVGAVKMRHLRAIQRLQGLLPDGSGSRES